MTARFALLAILVAGCGAHKASSAPTMAVQPSNIAAAGPPAPPPAPTAVASPAVSTGAKPAPDATVASAFVIYTGSVSMLEDPDAMPALVDRIVDTAEAAGGRLHARRDDGVTIRVPSARFRETMSKLDGLGVVTHRSVKADDVSEEFHDAEVRLLNLKATRQRLQELLAKAQTVADTLTVERELERVALEIDRLQGRLRFLSDRASLSIIDVAIAAKPRAPAVVAAPTAPPRRRGIALPIRWLARVDAEHLATFE